jgi:16S rRNA (guanine1207-N2)-methyltransferase
MSGIKIDSAFQLIRAGLVNRSSEEKILWIADENISAVDIAVVQPSENLQVMTNRFNVAEQLSAKGFAVSLGDYDFTHFDKNSFDSIFYRVSKEKAVVHHVINCAGRYLKPSAILFLAGFKNDGMKTYVSKATDYLNAHVEKQRGPKMALLAQLTCGKELAEPLDDKNYQQLQTISIDDVSFITKPGIYGWKKQDDGSAFLLQHLTTVLASLALTPERVLDLGCGYGYLSVMANRLLPAHYIATDNNVAAVAVCEKNFAEHGVDGEVILADCADQIAGQVDFVLCNPPFHQGFDVESDLSLRFVTAAKRLLKKKGAALFVVNCFIPIEKKAAGMFVHVDQIANNGSFKLVLAR